jgi:hypothetical protein
MAPTHTLPPTWRKNHPTNSNTTRGDRPDNTNRKKKKMNIITDRTRTEQGLFAAAAVAVLAVFLPWIKITAPFIGSITGGPMDGSDGWFIMAAIAVTVALAWFQKRTATLVAAGVTAAIIGYEVIHLITSVNDVMAGEAGEMIATSYSLGMFLAAIAAVGLVVAAVKNRKAPTATPAVETEVVATEV